MPDVIKESKIRLLLLISQLIIYDLAPYRLALYLIDPNPFSINCIHIITFLLLYCRYPDLISKAVLLDGGGFFPVWADNSAYIASMFKMGLPQFPLRLMGR
jgi:hypothetical protein